jgi:hypothetical protein
MRIMREEPYLYCFYEPTPGTTFDTFHSPGVAGDGFVYVTDDQHQLARIATNGEAFEILAAQANANTEPFISCPSTGYLFYGKRGTGDDGLPLYRFDVSAKTEEAVRTGRVIATLQSGALAAMDGMLYFNHDLEILAVSQTNISSVKSVSGAPARGKPGKRTNYPIAIGTRGPHPYKILIYAYSNGKDNVLHWEGLTALQMDFSTLPIAAAPSVCGDGRVVCRGKDNNLYIANFIH